MPNTKFNLETLARPNIRALVPYRCARDDYDSGVLLDANENPHGPAIKTNKEESEYSLNRYPDPRQNFVKQLLCDLRNAERQVPKPITPDNIFMGVGSDEAIDALIRCFCVPGKDQLLTCPPTYGMYSVSAQINDVGITKVPLAADFSLRPDAIIEALNADPTIKLLYICSPGNPTAKLVDEADVRKVLNADWNGVVVVDEAYIDFAQEGASVSTLVNEFPNLVVMQTLSKSFGLAGVRAGFTFSSVEIAALLNNMKAPYNISTPAAEFAARALSEEGVKLMKTYTQDILEQRARILDALPGIEGVGKVIGGLDANFLLFEILNKAGEPDTELAFKVYEQLAESRDVVVRFRGKEPGCAGALRASIGTKTETDVLLDQLKQAIAALRQ